ncbi:hypothetical protein LGT39_10460 [Demequina sp. TTPB684]|uniref:hypothetical protein n=1 Tax=unclassified Demequina TaxID=2620311 RepID=UPI001CF1475E|nr:MULTISPECIES: hypothetical protein [unclassified Demequina]MCB2413264.1 hypothetical protein [Demequina sp. TTPB684]UPU88724.1 hypothetical protein LGT36_002030 [Demequina sp. TMPB413]
MRLTATLALHATDLSLSQSLANWLGVGAQLGLLAAAVVAAIYAHRSWRIAQKSASDRFEFARRKQAAAISAWTADAGPGRLAVVVSNASDAPVFRLNARTVLAPPAGGRELGLRRVEIVPPNSREFVVEYELSERDSDADFYVEVTFSDASGAWWHRDYRGVLTEDLSEKYLC